MADKVTGLIEIQVKSTGVAQETQGLNKLTGAAESAAGETERLGIVEEKVTRIRERSTTALISMARQLDTVVRKTDKLAAGIVTLNRSEAAGLSKTGEFIAARQALSKAINDNAAAFEKLKTSMEKSLAVAAGMTRSGGMSDPTGMTSRMSSAFKSDREKAAAEADAKARATLLSGMTATGGRSDPTSMAARMSQAFRDDAQKLVKDVEKTAAETRAKIAVAMSSMGGRTDPTSMTARMSASTRSVAETSKMNRQQWANLSAQLQDVFVMTASGASPITTLVQQGPQIADVFANNKGGATAALKEFGSVALRVATHPLTALVAVMGSAAVAAYKWSAANATLTTSLNGLGRGSGLTVNAAGRAADAGASQAGISRMEARGVAGQLLSAGVSGSSIGSAVGLSGQFARKMGMSLEDAGRELASSLADPARGAEDLAKKYGLVSFAQTEHIKQLAAVGDKSKATAALVDALRKSLADAQDPTSKLGQLWDKLTNTLSDSITAWGELITEGPTRFFSGAVQAEKEAAAKKKATELAAKADADAQQQRAKDLAALQQDAAFATQQVMARTFAEREAIATQQAYTQTFRQTYDAVKASIAAEGERVKILAESVRKSEDILRAERDSSSLVRMSPAERSRAEIQQRFKTLREELLPSADSPAVTAANAASATVKTAFEAAATAADSVTAAFNGLAGAAGRQPGLAPIGLRAGARTIDISRPGMNDPRGLASYIVEKAKALGVDPQTALRVAQSEGLGTFSGDGGSSFGAFQLHRGGMAGGANAVGGLGDDFFRQTGLDPSDPANERATIDFALKHAARNGWSAFHGAAKAGIGQFEGINARGNIGSNLSAAQAAAESANQFALTDKPLQDANAEINRQRAALEARNAAFGKSTEEIARAAKEQELINQYDAQGVKVTEELRAGIEATAYNYGQLAKETEDAADAQKRLVENLDFVRTSGTDALGGITTDLMHGKKAADALADALSRVMDRLIQMAANRAIEGIFGKMGEASGGIFGSMFSSGPTAVTGGAGAIAVPTFSAGGVVGGLGGSMMQVHPSVFNGAKHYATGGPVPIIAHAGELVLNAAQQHNVAAAIRNGGNDNRAVAAPVTVNLIGAPEGTKVQEQTDSTGSRRIDVVFDERIASAITSPQGAAAMRSQYGMASKVARR